MKKLLCTALALMLLFCLATPAMAVSGSVSLKASSATLYRGDTFTVTATLSSGDAIALGTVKLHYDSNALELTGGTCHVSNTSLAQVIPSQNVGTFMLNGDPATVSGKIFTFQFRVKDSAAFGSYTISSNASIGVNSGESIHAGSAAITVACRHSYGDPVETDGKNHSSTCSICQNVKTVAHSWNSGTVLTAATCKATGTKKLTCTGCGATKQETIPVSGKHTYSKWTQSGNGHSHTCSVCGKQETASHTWKDSKILTAATCQEEGSKQVVCVCGATKTVTVKKAAHDNALLDQTELSHKYRCKDCGQETVEDHNFGSTLSHDERKHFSLCSSCGYKKDPSEHIPGAEATKTTDQVCTVCSRILQPRGEHIHTPAPDWITDETGHWQLCTACGQKDGFAPHIYDCECDMQCNVCLMQRQLQPQTQWITDETGHWFICEKCNQKTPVAEHTPGPAATVTTPQSCTVCHFLLAPVLPHEHIYSHDHTHSCACGEVYLPQENCRICKSFPWEIVCIAEGAVIAVLLTLLFLKKRRKKS